MHVHFPKGGFPVFPSMCTLAGRLGCGARWRFETPLKSSLICSSQRSCSERTACHPAAPGSPQTGESVPEGSSAPAPGPVQENNQQHLHFYYIDSVELCRTLMRISSFCSHSLWFWKRFSSFQMFSSRSASVDASPAAFWAVRECSDVLVTFSISTSWHCGDTWEWETGEKNRNTGTRSERVSCGQWNKVRSFKLFVFVFFLYHQMNKYLLFQSASSTLLMLLHSLYSLIWVKYIFWAQMGKPSIIIGALLWLYRPFQSSMQKSLNHVNLLHIFSAPTMTINFLLQSVLLTHANWPKSYICAFAEDTLSLVNVLSALCCKV